MTSRCGPTVCSPAARSPTPTHQRTDTFACPSMTALLQGFPADWRFSGAVHQALGQIGNSVCPPSPMRWLGRSRGHCRGPDVGTGRRTRARARQNVQSDWDPLISGAGSIIAGHRRGRAALSSRGGSQVVHRHDGVHGARRGDGAHPEVASKIVCHRLYLGRHDARVAALLCLTPIDMEPWIASIEAKILISNWPDMLPSAWCLPTCSMSVARRKPTRWMMPGGR